MITIQTLDWAARVRADIANLRNPVLLDAAARMTDGDLEKVARILRADSLPEVGT
jgi:hypothetical protein